uniref:Uncharacterized protein n=1 Tax=Rhizophora mucronata TaxID=61149 RepID=A0A2P2P465_RHIMU
MPFANFSDPFIPSIPELNDVLEFKLTFPNLILESLKLTEAFCGKLLFHSLEGYMLCFIYAICDVFYKLFVYA